MSQSNNRLIFLYTEVMSYTEAIFSELAKRSFEIHVVEWIKERNTPRPTDLSPGIFRYDRDRLKPSEISRLVLEINPVLTYVSGWQDKGYLPACRRLIKSGKAVICGFDDQWRGTFRQRFGGFLGSFGLLRLFFSHAWIAGYRQYEFARRLGFEHSEIIFELLPCSSHYEIDHDIAFRKPLPSLKNFLYVGRFSEEKGIMRLLETWQMIQGGLNDWKLTLVGDVGGGISSSTLRSYTNVSVFPFSTEPQLLNHYLNASCVLVPSIKDQWSVALHEAVRTGRPIITSSAVGASSNLVINKYNGFIYDEDNPLELGCCLTRMVNSSAEELIGMGKKSLELGKRINIETSLSNFLSLV